MEKSNTLEIIQKHVFESIDYALDASVNILQKPKLKDPNNKMGDLGLTKDTLFFTDFQTYIRANISMNEFWGENKVYLLTIKEFKDLILKEYLRIQKSVQKNVTAKYLSANILKQYKTLTPSALHALQKLIETQLINR